MALIAKQITDPYIQRELISHANWAMLWIGHRQLEVSCEAGRQQRRLVCEGLSIFISILNPYYDMKN